MKTFWLFLAAAAMLGSIPQTQAAETPQAGSSTPKIGASEAADHYGRMMTVTGKVAQVTIREKLVYVNLDKAFPNSPFTAVIFSRATNQFGNLENLKGKQIEITGRVEEFKEKPQIILNHTNQIRVVK